MVLDAEIADTTWRGLYRLAGWLPWSQQCCFLSRSSSSLSGCPPSTVVDTFTLFHNNRLLGLLDFDLLGIVIYILLVPTLLALYVVLRRASASFTAIGTVFFFVGITVYFASNTSFCMLYLSDQYVAATTDVQRSMFLAAGQAMFTIFNVTAFEFSYVVVSAALLIVAVVMLRSTIFSRTTAYAGILANALAVGSIAVGSIPLIFIPTISVFLSLFSIVPLLIWFALIGRRLFQLGRNVPREEVNPNWRLEIKVMQAWKHAQTHRHCWTILKFNFIIHLSDVLIAEL